MTRIHYKQDGRYLVSHAVMVEEKFAFIQIDPTLLIYHIKDCTNDMLLFSGQCNTIVEIKKEAKDTLRAMGAKFYDEIRAKSKLELE